MANSVAVKTSNTFLAFLDKSGLLSTEQLKVAQQLSETSDNPKVIARKLVDEELLTTWQARQLLAGGYLLTLGKYKLLNQTSSDEFGRVYHAEHQQLGREVSIRALTKRQTKNEGTIQQFLTDAQQIAALDHRNIVHVYDVDRHGGRYCVVMEYVGGRDLQSLVEEDGPLGPTDAGRLVMQAAEGLAHAHERKMLHRDVRPSRLLIDLQNDVKISDFGVGRVGVDKDADAAEPTSSYWSPERRANEELTEASDIYSLGGVLFFLLTGKAPSDDVKEIRRILVDAQMDEPLIEICCQMLAKEPADRFESAREIRETLAKWRTEYHTETSRAAAEKADQAKAKRKEIAAKTASKKLPVAQSLAGGAAAAEAVSEPTKGSTHDTIDINLGDDTSPGGGFGVDTGGGGFGINTDAPRRKRRKKKPQQQPQPVDNSGEMEAHPMPAQGFSLSPMAITLGAAGIAVLLIGVTVFAVFFLLADDDESDVAANDPEASAPADPDADAEGGGDKEGEGDEEGEDKDDDAANPGDKPGDDPAPAEQPKDGEGDDPKDELPDNQVADVGKPEDPEVVPNDPDLPEDPEPDPDEDPDPVDEPEPDPEPEPEPPKPAPKVEPFQGFSPIVALPAVGEATETTPATLGPAVLTDGALCFVDLMGYLDAIPGTKRFILNNADGGTNEREWDISVGEGEEATSGTVIAKLMAVDNELKFYWTAAAQNESAAGGLQNCMIRMRAGDGSHLFALREPVKLQPITVDLDRKGSMNARIVIPNPPEMGQVEFIITELSGFPKGTTRPGQSLSKDAPTIDIQTAEQIIGLQIAGKFRRNLELTTAASVKLIASQKPMQFNQKAIRGFASQALAEQQRAFAEANKLKQVLNRVPKQQKARFEQQISLLEQSGSAAQEALQNIEKLEAAYTAINKTALIHYKVIYKSGAETDLVLATTK